MTEAKFDVCPYCWSDLRAGEIPTDALLKGYYGPWQEGDPPRWFSRLVGIVFRHPHPLAYDGVGAWQCPDCGATWNRWTGELLEPQDV